jgi:hypothetical protein
MPLNPPRTSDETLYLDQDHPLADFTFDRALDWHQSPPPYRVLISLAKNIRPSDLRQGMLLAARLGWEIVGGKRWRHVQVLRAVAPATLRTEGVTADLVTPNEPTNFSALLARAPRTDRPGGARGNVGRKALAQGDITEAHSITLPASAWRLLEEIGRGNRSEGVRRLVTERRGTLAEEPG